MHEMDTKVEATCPNNSYVANPDMIKEEGFDKAIKSEPELEENDLHDYPLAIKDESVEHSDGIESEVEVIIPYTINDECDSVALKSESELEGNDLDDDPTTIKSESFEYSDEAGSKIEAISSYGEEDEGDVGLELTKEEFCEDQYEASVKSGDIESPNEGDSDLANSIALKEEAVQNDNEPSDVINLSEGWPEDRECDQADDGSDGDDSDDFGAAVVLVPRRPSGPPSSGGAQQQMYAPEPESPTRTSTNRRRKHGAADLGPTNDQQRSKRARLEDDMIDEEPIFLHATALENS
ncbi:Ff.00g090480.m01.CDS01 [Fusarium sp. VM40]|nr:Ff.00g090480.m01.CDS01 [Fusarium sp. VM40]